MKNTLALFISTTLVFSIMLLGGTQTSSAITYPYEHPSGEYPDDGFCYPPVMWDINVDPGWALRATCESVVLILRDVTNHTSIGGYGYEMYVRPKGSVFTTNSGTGFWWKKSGVMVGTQTSIPNLVTGYVHYMRVHQGCGGSDGDSEWYGIKFSTQARNFWHKCKNEKWNEYVEASDSAQAGSSTDW